MIEIILEDIVTTKAIYAGWFIGAYTAYIIWEVIKESETN